MSKYWRQVIDRMIKTGFQAVGVVIGIGTPSAWDLNWMNLTGTLFGGMLLSFITSMASTGLGPDKTDPSVL